MFSAEVHVTMMETSALPETIRQEAAGKRGILSLEGRLWLVRGDRALCCEDSPEAQALLSVLASPEPETKEQALQMILSSGDRAAELARHFDIRAEGPRCLILMCCAKRRGLDLEKAVRSVAPLEKDDLLIRYSSEVCVLLKQGDDPGEAAEYALALLDTVESETGLRPEAGVSDPHTGAGEWAEAFREAESALKTGRAFRLEGPVQVYRQQRLERLLSGIPEDKRRAFRRQVFGDGCTLNAELTETAEIFLRSDLNLSDTARQMFIHRNTLTYRLDKIRKETGLDLRRFSDAVIFRVLTAMPEDPDGTKQNER